MKIDRDRCIAIAGVFQAAELASQIAHRGMADSLAVETSIHSLFQTDADTVSEVYGGILGIATGLNAMAARLEGGDLKEVNTIRYVVALLNLERKLSKKREMLKQVSKGISLATERLSHFNLLHSNIIAQLADIYASTVSTLKPRIMIHGEPLHLQNPENANRIRALLLAGMRSAMLWRQCGGGRFQILFARKHLLKEIQSLLTEIQ